MKRKKNSKESFIFPTSLTMNPFWIQIEVARERETESEIRRDGEGDKREEREKAREG